MQKIERSFAVDGVRADEPFDLAAVAQAESSFRAARAGSTLRAYTHDWQQFRLWCERNVLLALPASPQTVPCVNQ